MTTEEAMLLIEGPICADARLASTVGSLFARLEANPLVDRIRGSTVWRGWGGVDLYEMGTTWALEERTPGYAHPRDMEMAVFCYLLKDRILIDTTAQGVLIRLSIALEQDRGLFWTPRMARHILEREYLS